MRGVTRVLAACALVGGAAAHGATLRVPEDYPSLLAAVDATASGDSVVVGPGTWSQTATRVVIVNGQSLPVTACAFLKPGIVIAGRDGAATTVVQTAVGDGLVHVTGGAATTVVKGLTVAAGVAVIASHNSVLEAVECSLVDNSVAAVDASASARVILRSCLLEGNSWNRVGSGYAVLSFSSPVELYDCEIRDNLGKRAMRIIGASQVVVDGCAVSGHVSGGACLFESVPDLQIRNSVFTGNRNTGNGGAITATSSVGVVEFCVFDDDSALAGGGIAAVLGAVRIENNTFYSCEAVIGSAIEISGNDPGVRNNIIAHSRGQYGAVDRTQGVNDPMTGCNLFWGSEVQDYSSVGTWTPSPTDLFADPQFCDPLNDDLTLHSTSPGAPGVTPACGPIGALEVGCGPVSVEGSSWGRIKAQYRQGGER